MKKRGKIRASVLLAAAFLTLWGLWARAGADLHYSRTELEYGYRRALNDLTDAVSAMGSVLQKAPYVNTPVMQGAVSAQILEQSGGAKAAMAVLPLSQERSDRISRFLSQAGDYALTLNRRSAAGGALEEQDLENLAVLEEYAGKLAQALQGVQAGLAAEGTSLGRTESLLSNLEELDSLPTLDDSFDEAAKEFAQFPSLLYDGPFSDHVQRREALFLQGRREVTRKEAAEKAAAFLDCRPEDLDYSGQGGSQFPLYSFTLGDSHVNVTKAGGEISYFKRSGAVSASRLTPEEAVEKARSALEELGIGPVRESFYAVNDNLCTVNFSPILELADGEGGAREALCYPDLLKVSVELEQGGMVEYDAAGYVMNHRERKLPVPALSAEEAAKSLSARLTAGDPTLALVPTPGLEEALCWEFPCTAKDDPEKEFLVYINAVTGLEEQLYLLQRDSHGVLAK